MENPLISIIVPCYNQAQFLSEALESVLQQTYSNWECIIINDGSIDNTEAVASDWLQKDSRFKYVIKINGGLSSARNAGIKNSLGNFILPLDADDILHKDFITKLLPELLLDNTIGIVSCYENFFRENISTVFYKKQSKGGTLKDLMFENIMMASSLYRKECWEQVGGYDEKMLKGFEDWEFWINITKRGWKFKFVEEFLFYYRKSKNSMLTDTLKNHVEDNIEYVFNKHMEIYIENFETTLYYLLFLLKRHKTSEVKLKQSPEYKIGKAITRPYRLIQKLFKS